MQFAKINFLHLFGLENSYSDDRTPIVHSGVFLRHANIDVLLLATYAHLNFHKEMKDA